MYVESVCSPNCTFAEEEAVGWSCFKCVLGAEERESFSLQRLLSRGFDYYRKLLRLRA